MSGLSSGKAQISKLKKTIPALVTEKLNADDRLIAAIEALSLSTERSLDDIPQQPEHSQELVNVLPRIQSQALRTKLDRVYLQELHSLPPKASDHAAHEDTILKEVRDDLNSLFSEIEDVNTMLVSHHYGEPLHSAFDSLHIMQKDIVAGSAEKASLSRPKLSPKLTD